METRTFSPDFRRPPRDFSRTRRSNFDRRRLESVAGQGEHRLGSATVDVRNLDQELCLEDVLGKMGEAGNVVGYYVFGAWMDDERIVFGVKACVRVGEWKHRNAGAL